MSKGRSKKIAQWLAPGQTFDAIIGNPPFIRYQSFPAAQQALAFSFMQQQGFHPNRLTHAWVPFLVAAAFLVKPQGRLAFVILAELFQVSYASENRRFLSKHFHRINLVTIKRLVFADIQQEVILLLAERGGRGAAGIRVFELNGVLTFEPSEMDKWFTGVIYRTPTRMFIPMIYPKRVSE